MAKLERKTRDQRMVAAAVEAKKEYSAWNEAVRAYFDEMLDAVIYHKINVPGLEREVCLWR